MIKIGVANEGETNMEIEILKSWIPKNISYVRDITFFKYEDKYYSIKTIDFKQIFNK